MLHRDSKKDTAPDDKSALAIPFERIQPLIVCALTHKVFSKPVSIDGCGHVFESDALNKRSKKTCPLCHQNIKNMLCH